MLTRFLNINETWWWRIVSETGTSLIEVFLELVYEETGEVFSVASI